MKKIYIAPINKAIELDLNNVLLTGSDGYDDSMNVGNNTDGSSASGMNTRENTNLWDQEW